MRSLGDFYMVSEASANLGISQFTLRKWIAGDDEELWPSRTVMFGKVQIYLYTPEDLRRISAAWNRRASEKYSGNRKGVGRPRVYTDAERKVRGRLQSQRYYWRVRHEEAIFNGDVEMIRRTEKKINEIENEMRK